MPLICFLSNVFRTDSQFSSKSTDHPINVVNFTPEQRAYGLQLGKNPVTSDFKQPEKASRKYPEDHKVYQIPRDHCKGVSSGSGGKVYHVSMTNKDEINPLKTQMNGKAERSGKFTQMPTGGVNMRQQDVTTDSVPAKAPSKMSHTKGQGNIIIQYICFNFINKVAIMNDLNFYTITP